MSYNLGAYYFGGWVHGEPGITWRPDPWAANDTTNDIYMGDAEFRGRWPLYGMWNEAQQWTMNVQINDAADYGLDFFAFDFYWTGTGTFHHMALQNFMRSKFNHRMKFYLMFANHTRNFCDSQTQWRACIDWCIANVFHHPQYMKIDGKPVVQMFDVVSYLWHPSTVVTDYPTKTYVGNWAASKAYALNEVVQDYAGHIVPGTTNRYYECTTAHTSGANMATHSANWTFLQQPDNLARSADVKAMLDDARSRAQTAGHAGIYFLGWSPAHPFWLTTPNKILERAGFNAFSQYRPVQSIINQDKANGTASTGPVWTNYDETDIGLRADWDWILQESGTTLKAWLPFHAGYDKAPWVSAASRASRVTRAQPTVAQFRAHCEALKARLDAYPDKTDKTAICYAWNENGEGGFLVPSIQYRYALLDAIRTTFGKKPGDRAQQRRMRSA